ncbi:hypothetical protein D3C73_1668830 [compost metagenome]
MNAVVFFDVSDERGSTDGIDIAVVKKVNVRTEIVIVLFDFVTALDMSFQLVDEFL